MQPELVSAFVAEFAAEWNRLLGDCTDALASGRRALAQVERKLEGLIDAVTDELRTEGLRQRLEALEAERARLS